MASDRTPGGGCLMAAAALFLGVSALVAAPLLLLQQANGVTLERPLYVAGAPMDFGWWPGATFPPPAQGEQEPVPVSPSGWVRPIAAPLTSGFGWRPNPTGWGWDYHTGVDWGAPWGTPVRAAGPGTVVFVGWYGGYGILVRISHGQGIETWYGHLAAASVRPGQAVRAGEVIGLVGSTGRSTGPHLHFEVRVNGQPVDPLNFLAGGGFGS